MRLNALLERAVLPGSSHLLDTSDPMEAELSSKRVQAITDYYSGAPPLSAQKAPSTEVTARINSS